MASELIRPTVTGFLDKMLRLQNRTIRVDEIPVGVGSRLAGKSLGESGLLNQQAFSVVAIMSDGSDSYSFNPAREAILIEGQTVVVIGDIAAIEVARNTF
jgi:K+/H+ antiporter YhaU regulatory subunit KhtT